MSICLTAIPSHDGAEKNDLSPVLILTTVTVSSRSWDCNLGSWKPEYDYFMIC